MDFRDQVKSSVDIVQVVGEYVRLRKAGGARYIGLCPFHNEKTPSFGVSPVHQYYKCFGCGEGGDVLSFVMKIDGLSFFEALKLLAERNGIPIPKRHEYSDPETRQRAAIFQMHEIAEAAFREHLFAGFCCLLPLTVPSATPMAARCSRTTIPKSSTRNCSIT